MSIAFENFCPTVDWIHQLAEDSLLKFDKWRQTERAEACRINLRSKMQSIADFNERRCLRAAEKQLTVNTVFGRWTAQLFLSFRDKTAMTDYLRFQEWAFERESSDPLKDINAGIHDTFSDLGKGSSLNVGIGICTWDGKALKFSLALDPFVNFRAIYLRMLRNERRGKQHSLFDKAFFLIHRTIIRTKFWIIERGCEKYFRYATDRIKLQPKWIPANIARHCETLAKDLLSESIDSVNMPVLEDALSVYMVQRIESLSNAVPKNILERGGASKFFKVWIGVLIGRLSIAPEDQQDMTQYILTSFQLAFCWASTYPLIDDILDSGDTSSLTKHELVELMQCVFADGPRPSEIMNRSCRELFHRMNELVQLIDPLRRDATKQAILNVFDAHVQDAKFGLQDDLVSPKERLQTSLLKSMLVRIATMHVCGISPTEDDYREMAPIAIFNQLGDDIWDIREDLEEGRATPVTVGVQRESFDPFAFYLDFGAYLTEFHNVGRSASLAISHTYRLAWEAVDESTKTKLTQSLTSFSPDLDPDTFFKGIQHVDPDSLIFDFEKAICKLT